MLVPLLMLKRAGTADIARGDTATGDTTTDTTVGTIVDSVVDTVATTAGTGMDTADTGSVGVMAADMAMATGTGMDTATTAITLGTGSVAVTAGS